MKGKKAIYVIFILIQSLVYGIGNPITKIAYQSITPLWLLAIRFTMASVVLSLFCGKRIFSAAKKAGIRLWMPSALCCAGAYISCNISLSMTSATNVGFIMSLPVLFAPALSAVITKSRYKLSHLPLQLITIAGLFLLCCNGGAFAFGAGEALALLDALCLAGQLVFGEKAMQEMDVLSITSLQVITTMVVSVAGALMFDDISVLSGIQPAAYLIAAYHAMICTIAAYLLQNTAVRHLSASAVSMLQCTQPIMTAVIAIIILGERLTGIGLIGASIIVLCLVGDSFLSSKENSKRD